MFYYKMTRKLIPTIPYQPVQLSNNIYHLIPGAISQLKKNLLIIVEKQKVDKNNRPET